MKLTDIQNNETVEEAIDTDHPDAVQIPLDKAFGADDEKLAAERQFLLDEFAKDLNQLVENAIEDAYDIGGEFKGPGITSQLEKILRYSTFRQR